MEYYNKLIKYYFEQHEMRRSYPEKLFELIKKIYEVKSNDPN